MKKLRKSLALIMALVMLSGLFVFAGPAVAVHDDDELDKPYTPYTDQADINEDYEQAIVIFTRMRVAEGFPDGSLQPKGFLQRDQAATYIARTLVSRAAVDDLDRSYSPFTDVMTDEWYTGSINFAFNRGIVAGVGNNEFNPRGTLTKVQWVRILLSTLGWGKNGEFEGYGWENRVYETATNARLDLFGSHLEPGRWQDYEGNRFRINVPESGWREPITREEALALLDNAIRRVPKVDWNMLTGYGVTVANPGLGGSNLDYICKDIGLEYAPGDYDRDNYGRPIIRGTNTWFYRGRVILESETGLPDRFGEERITPNMTATELRLLLQGVSEIDKLEVHRAVSIWVNGYPQDEDDIDDNAYYIRKSGEPSALELLITGAAFSALAAGVQSSYEPVDTSPWSILDAYLRGRAGNIAFGPSVTLEIYIGGGAIDIILIDSFLVQFREKREDDVRTPLVNESRVVFNLFRGPGSTAEIVTSVPYDGENEPLGLTNWAEFFDNAGLLNNYYLATPRGRLLPIGGITAFTESQYSGNEGTLINEVYDAKSTVTGIAGASAPTRLAVGGTPYAMGLFRPTVNTLDNTHNYTFYLDDNDVIIGAAYTSPGRPSMTNVLLLNKTVGRAATTSDVPIVNPGDRAYAFADIITGAGRRVPEAVLPFSARGGTGARGSYTAPDGVPRDLPPASQELDGYNVDWYFFNLNSGVYTLVEVPIGPGVATSNYRALSSNDINIKQGQLSIGNLGALATDRTILTVISGQTGHIVRNGVSRFPDIAVSDDAEALVLLEPGDNTRIAEILYINPGTVLDIGVTTYYGYLLDEPELMGDLSGRKWANFVINETQGAHQERMVINRGSAINVTLGVNNTSRFYKLVLDENNEWSAEALDYVTSGGVANGVNLGFLSGTVTNTMFGLAGELNGSPAYTVSYHSTLRMPIVSVLNDTTEEGLGVGVYVGDNISITGVGDKAVAVIIESGGAVAAFVLNKWADGLPTLE